MSLDYVESFFPLFSFKQNLLKFLSPFKFVLALINQVLLFAHACLEINPISQDIIYLYVPVFIIQYVYISR